MLFTDLVGSTELASTLDPEDWRDILGEYHRRIASIVADHGGLVSQFQGDGALAFFGYPQAVETSGRDAVGAALVIAEAVAHLGASLPPGLGVQQMAARVGIHTGVVVVGPNRAPSGDQAIGVFGEVPNLAARLQAAAAPGEVLLSAATASLARGLFDLEPLPPLKLKGISRAVQAYRALGPSGARSRLEARQLVNFIARSGELAWLEEQWQEARRGPACCILVIGEAGIGKSRLMLEFGRRVQERGARVVTAYCNRADSLSPLQPFGALMGAVPDDPDSAAAWVEDLTAEGPAMFVLDDAHWADPSTLEVVDRLAQRNRPLLIAVTARPQILRQTSVGFPTSRRLALDRLSRADARAIVRRMPGGTALPSGITDALVERADGVPLYLEELTRSLVEGAASDPTAIPETLTEVITARLDRLGGAKGVAQLASVIGREFDEHLLGEISGLGPAELSSHLRVLSDQAVVERSHPREGSLWFRHALIHEAAYRSLLRSDRRTAHGRVADALLASGEAPPQIVAHHLGEGGRPEEAADTWRQASRLARRNSRFREAAGHERQILRLLPSLPDEQRDTIELHARRRLAICLTTVDQSNPEAIKEGRRALELGTRLGNDNAVLEIYLVLIPWWQAQADYASIREVLPGAIRLAERATNKWFLTVLTLYQATIQAWQGELTAALDGLSSGWSASGLPVDQSLSSVPLLRGSGTEPGNGLQVLVLASVRAATALTFWLTGDVRRAWDLADDTLLFAAESRVPPAQAVASATAAILAQLEGDPRLTAELARTAEELPDEVATLQWRRWASVLRWWAGDRVEAPPVPGPMLRAYFLMLLAGSARMPVEESIALLDQALAAARSTGERFCEAEILRTRAHEWWQAGDPRAADVDLAAALEVARSQQARSLELRALNDRVCLLGDRAARSDLRQVIAAIGTTGPQHDVEAANRLLQEGD